MRALFFLLLLLVSCKKDLNSVNPIDNYMEGIGTDEASLKTFTDEYMDLVNDHRRSLGLAALIYSKEIETQSLEHSRDMASGLVAFGHAGSSIRCSKIKSALGGGNLCGEIVAKGQATPEAVFKSWMSSTLHRQKIESSRYTHTGLGIAKNLAGTIYWTQIFLEL